MSKKPLLTENEIAQELKMGWDDGVPHECRLTLRQIINLLLEIGISRIHADDAHLTIRFARPLSAAQAWQLLYGLHVDAPKEISNTQTLFHLLWR
jgi:hypothetical protein